MDREDVLAGVKKGDYVLEYYGGFGSRLEKRLVTHTTTTQVHSDSRRYRRSDGYVIGDSSQWFRTSASKFDAARWAEHQEKLRRESTVRKLSELNWSAVGWDVRDKVIALLEATDATR